MRTMSGSKVVGSPRITGFISYPSALWHAISNKNHLVSGRLQIDTRRPSSGLHPLRRVLQTWRRVLVTRLACWCVWARERGPFSLSRGATFNELRLEIVEAFRDVFGIYMSQTTLALLVNTFVYTMHHGESI